MDVIRKIIKTNITINIDASLIQSFLFKNILIIISIIISSYPHIIIILNQQINNMDKPKISIFLPIYNKEKYLKRSIKSIQKQTLKDIEIIAVNDCSTDNSLDLLNELAKKDPRIKIVNNKKNKGLLFSRAMGILNSKGEYLMNLDPDDQLKGTNNLKYLYNKAKRYNVDMIIFIILHLPDKISYGEKKFIR